MARFQRNEPTPPEPADDDDRELSLNALSDAFAEAVGQSATGVPNTTGHVAAGTLAVAPVVGLPSEPGSAPEPVIEADRLASAPGDELCEVSPLSIVEALLFVGDPSGQPLAVDRLAGVMRNVESHEVRILVEELNRRYAAEDRPYWIASEGSGYRMCLMPEHARVRAKFTGRVKAARLTQAAVDVLALVAYHQPITSEEVQKVRGIPSGAVLSQLVRRQLLEVERPDPKARMLQYRTTQRFLDIFGLGSLDDLPTSREFDER